MKTVDIRSGLEVIATERCRALLATQQIGRLAFLADGRPDIEPVNYVVDGDAVVFATGAGTKLWALSRGPVAFEVDWTDAATRTGWSVVLHGHAQEVTEFDRPDLVERVRSLRVDPWPGGERPNLIRIAPTSISGRWVRDPRAGLTRRRAAQASP
jgi:nitroimidazol reductase NimA-like FMN-containing flavoprotein (pyridoxamine 5'-phosphate oxidase superfamily)